MRIQSFLVVLLFLLSAGPAFSATIAEQNPGTGFSGWSNNATSVFAGETVLGGFNVFGGGAQTQQTFALSGNQTSVTIDFDYWKIDSWDSERFQLYVDGAIRYDRVHQLNEGSQVGGNPFQPLWLDLLTSVSITVATTAPSVTVLFTSTLAQNPFDESWALRALTINDNGTGATVPEPGSGLLLLSGLTLLGRRRR